MPAKMKQLFGPLRTWIAPAIGVGLVAAGIAMAAGVSSTYGPWIGILVAAAILSFGHWRVTRGSRR